MPLGRSTSGIAWRGPRPWSSWDSCWCSLSSPAGCSGRVMAPPADGRVRLETQRLTALYGRRAAVKDVSILFPTPTVTAVIGPSAGGKSTFLRCLNRLHELAEVGWGRAKGLRAGAGISG